MAIEAASSSSSHRGRRSGIVAVVVVALWMTLLSVLIHPPEPTPCGSPGGPPVTATRVRLRDGRFLAYSEAGVRRESAKHKVVVSHGFGGSRLDGLPASPELLEELGVYIVSFDRAGYGESDANTNRTLRSQVSDIEELADSLHLGTKFYIIGFSLGGHAVWASLKYIPERIAGAALLAPVINYRWPAFPRNISTFAYKEQAVGDQWALRVSYYAPWLLHWWMKQSWLPTSTVTRGTVHLPNRLDAHLRDRSMASGLFQRKQKLATQQGIFESYHRDMIVMFGKWEFDPMDLQPPPFPVHLWQGDEDGLVPVTLQRYICGRLSWIVYHELQDTGHYLAAVPGLVDLVLKTLLVPDSY